MSKLLARDAYFSIEIVATRSQGIRYLIYAEAQEAKTIEHIVSAYTPDIKIHTVDNDIQQTESLYSRVLEYKQSAHFAYPLKAHEELFSHDPISYLTNAMTKLESSELMAMQLIIKPVHLRAAENLNKRIIINEDLLPKLGKNHIGVFGSVFTIINNFLLSLTGAVSKAYHSSSQEAYRTQMKDLEYKKQVAKRIKPVRTLSYFEHELVETISHKLEQPLFRVDLRILIQADNKQNYLSLRSY